MPRNEFAPVTPAEMLKEEFLAEYGLTQNRLAQAIGVSSGRVAGIANNRRRITADTARRLGLYFGNSPEFWTNLQTHYDLKMARRRLKPAEIEHIKLARTATRRPAAEHGISITDKGDRPAQVNPSTNPEKHAQFPRPRRFSTVR
jgi:addiction module HigA family antidote